MSHIDMSLQSPVSPFQTEVDSEVEGHAMILIVDDEPTNCKVLEMLLAAEGYATVSVQTGSDALEVVSTWTPDLIILDAMMPLMDGYAVSRILKSDPETAVIPIIMVTGLVGRASRINSLESGVDAHLTKPIDRDELCLRVRSLIKLKGGVQRNLNQSALLADQVTRNNQELRQLSAAVDSTTDIVVLVDRSTMKHVQVNAAAARFFGYSREELLSMGPHQVMEESREKIERDYEELIAGHADLQTTETWITSNAGVRTHFEVNRHAISDGLKWTIVVVAKDITQREISEEKMRHFACYDLLTELPNRNFFEEQLEQAIQLADAWNLQLVLIFLNLDNFRVFNECWGRPTGDVLLQAVAKRLSECLYTRDTIARLGSDEFAVIALTPREPQFAVNVSGKILEALRQPFNIAQHTIGTSASLGISLYPNDASDIRSLSRYADLAMTAAKRGGRNTARFYTAAMNVQALKRLEVETALREALARDEFLLYYQPKICLRTGVWTGVEALLRWDRPGHGIVLPGTFITALEDTGLIAQVGAWVLGEACRQLNAWQEAGIGPLPIAINVSAFQLTREEPAAMAPEPDTDDRPDDVVPPTAHIRSAIAGCLHGLALPKGLLEIEITESAMMADTERNLSMLHQLKEMGIGLSLDDFGTGYSSLSYLARFPLDTVKIDGSFIRGLATTARDASITQAIIKMAHQLGIKVIAECVETAEQVDFLRANRCDEAQGFFFFHPMPVESLEHAWRDARAMRAQALFPMVHAETRPSDSAFAQIGDAPPAITSTPG